MKQLKQFQALYPDYQVIFLHISGSRLYGTELPTSDTDYRGIFVPSLEDLILKKDIDQWTNNTKGTKEKNTEEDEDFTLWSIHKFIKLLQVGDTNAMDSLFAYGTHAEIFRTELMDKLHKQRELYYPESLRSFFGFALGQVKMYSVKGDKLRDVQTLITEVHHLLQPPATMVTISDLRGYLIEGNNVQWVSDNTAEYLRVLDKRFIVNVRLAEFLDKLKEIESKYGDRAKKAMENNSVDWKSMYHAFRVLIECEELITIGHIRFPLKDAKYLLKVRTQGYEPREAFEMLEALYDKVSLLEKTEGNYLKGVTRGNAEGLLLEHYKEAPCDVESSPSTS